MLVFINEALVCINFRGGILIYVEVMITLQLGGNLVLLR